MLKCGNSVEAADFSSRFAIGCSLILASFLFLSWTCARRLGWTLDTNPFSLIQLWDVLAPPATLPPVITIFYLRYPYYNSMSCCSHNIRLPL